MSMGLWCGGRGGLRLLSQRRFSSNSTSFGFRRVNVEDKVGHGSRALIGGQLNDPRVTTGRGLW
eukprot:CAMPEP_0184678708 /NCGR_PEP_ID=MMETSP0312-20130426/1509_1 /TAXON_ID=31354 /ORGANISM="Compsopogon coeruleus, Strain SAG 36.94" /LENGTH=63 /DNA_ID=CAMNT_0027127663 /DNA_START=9 /DNA_END=200 /DNA_ORIENTATION=+